MTEKERVRRNERYKEYKLAYAALMLVYPFGLEDIDGEIWKKIKFADGRYEISNYGRVKSFAQGEWKILKPYLHNIGYLCINLYYKDTYRKCKIHRLVAEAFIPNPENKSTIDHKFNNKLDNFFENLRWATQAENNQYAYDTGAKKTSGESYQAKLTDEQALWCRKVYKPLDKEFGISALAKKFGVKIGVISGIVNGKTYKNARTNILNKPKGAVKLSVFENLRNGQHYHILDEDYKREAHGEFARCANLCYLINHTDPLEKEKILELERELFKNNLPEKTFLTPPFQIDCACRVFLGKNVFANHGLTVMSVGTVTIEEGVMLAPEVGIFTVNHEFGNIRVIFTKEILIKKNAWIGARVSILPGVTIGENAIVGTGSVVTKDIPDNAVAVGNPARVIKIIK